MLQAIGDKAKAGIFTNATVQNVVRRAVNLRTDLIDQIDQRLEVVARRLNLATRRELKSLRRQIRELENQVQNLEGQLGGERTRADRAEAQLSDALRAAREAEQKARAKAASAPVPAAAAAPEIEAKPESKAEEIDPEKTVNKRTTRAKKKAEPDETA